MAEVHIQEEVEVRIHILQEVHTGAPEVRIEVQEVALEVDTGDRHTDQDRWVRDQWDHHLEDIIMAEADTIQVEAVQAV